MAYIQHMNINYLQIIAGAGLVGLAVYDFSTGNWNTGLIALSAGLADFGLQLNLMQKGLH